MTVSEKGGRGGGVGCAEEEKLKQVWFTGMRERIGCDGVSSHRGDMEDVGTEAG